MMKDVKRHSLIAGFAALILGCSSPEEPPPQAEPQPGADTVLSNGKILTVDEDFSIVEAIAIDGDRVLATGSNEEMLALADATTEVVDLEGRTVIPGLIDNHVHFIRTVQRWHQQARIDGVASREEALSIVAEHAASLQPRRTRPCFT
jgi:predicted amidohydrolase YtcJ